jgi:putative FmdB family regulatory protein
LKFRTVGLKSASWHSRNDLFWAREAGAYVIIFVFSEVAMPIYAYRCTSCGHEQDVMQKMSDAPLTVCPSCKAESFAKQLTAPGFQLKGSGWYATDFKGNGAKPAAKSEVPPCQGGTGSCACH